MLRCSTTEANRRKETRSKWVTALVYPAAVDCARSGTACGPISGLGTVDKAVVKRLAQVNRSPLYFRIEGRKHLQRRLSAIRRDASIMLVKRHHVTQCFDIESFVAEMIIGRNDIGDALGSLLDHPLQAPNEDVDHRLDGRWVARCERGR